MKMAVFWVAAPCSLVEVYQTTRRYNPQDSHLHTLVAHIDKRHTAEICSKYHAEIFNINMISI
jgi:hypothetical protein